MAQYIVQPRYSIQTRGGGGGFWRESTAREYYIYDAVEKREVASSPRREPMTAALGLLRYGVETNEVAF